MVLSTVEQSRLQLSRNTAAAKKSQYGQFFTPERTAAFMASLFPAAEGSCRLLDAGAGIGSLSVAFLERCRTGSLRFERVEVDAFEIDGSLRACLGRTLATYEGQPGVSMTLRETDFVRAAVDGLAGDLFAEPLPRYTHAILNPPYKKISSKSTHRSALRSIGIETVNLYSAFVALSVALAAEGGQIVAIIPRSFCNGPYYRPFREFVLDRAAIRYMHLFGSRSMAFKDDDVLQENVIVRLERGGKQGPVIVSTSTDDTFADLVIREHPFERIVSPTDTERFIHVPTSPKCAIDASPTIRYTLSDLGLRVSTGPVVDFRLKKYLRATPEAGTVPLLYPGHFSGLGTLWPMAKTKKPNAIVRNEDTEKWLYPSGFYCVVRRLSSKEERRRIVASVVDPRSFAGAPVLGFENHLNVFHEDRHGLPEALARGLALYLNSTVVDESFRSYSGHTQVNAADLKLMKFPSRSALSEFGRWGEQQEALNQSMIDEKVRTLIA